MALGGGAGNIRQRAQEGTGCDMIKAWSRMKIVGIRTKRLMLAFFCKTRNVLGELIGPGKQRIGSCQKHLGGFKIKEYIYKYIIIASICGVPTMCHALL